MQRPRIDLITVFGLGKMRPASGTWGSLPPVLVAALLLAVGLGQTSWPDSTNPAPHWNTLYWVIYHGVLLSIFIFFSAACLSQGTAAEAHFREKDPSNVVADEVAGQCLPLMFLPAVAIDTTFKAAITLVLAFLAFRIMDIVKPWPAGQLQRVPGGLGILIDDLFAGIYALVIVQVCIAITM